MRWPLSSTRYFTARSTGTRRCPRHCCSRPIRRRTAISTPTPSTYSSRQYAAASIRCCRARPAKPAVCAGETSRICAVQRDAARAGIRRHHAAEDAGESAEVFALGFGAGNLLQNSYRLSYLQDAQANPDGGFPTITTGVAARPGLPWRQALQMNDLRNWVPTVPVLLCGGDVDPLVFWLNTQLMQGYWASHAPASASISVPISSHAIANDPYASLKEDFAPAKACRGERRRPRRDRWRRAGGRRSLSCDAGGAVLLRGGQVLLLDSIVRALAQLQVGITAVGKIPHRRSCRCSPTYGGTPYWVLRILVLSPLPDSRNKSRWQK